MYQHKNKVKKKNVSYFIQLYYMINDKFILDDHYSDVLSNYDCSGTF